ncbi:MAG: DUF420 domain-containing protein [Planctomycetes bacterium]|nr:DUF420 domain-containing protein [Planctomycetota bacterium]MCB9916770.1 DUF420 domain-containing protein [Planctomycetota bacterium]
MTIQDLPALNAILNACAAICMVAGVIAIRTKREKLHVRLMLTAVAFSALFLISYLTYHGFGESKKFLVEGFWRYAYFAMLLTHVVLAVVVVPLVILSVVRGLRGQREKHRKIVRITFPIWLYVSVTGVLVYFSVHVWQ